MAIQHTLWVVDRIGPSHLTGNQVQTLVGAMSVLNLAFMAPLISNLLTDRVSAQLTSAPQFTPGDAVVFLVSNVNRSLIQTLRGTINVSAKSLGMSSIAQGTPSLCEVYWERGFSDLEMAGAVFHEAAHGMSQQADTMHTFFSPGVGGPGVRVLAAQQPGIPQFPSGTDLDFYTSAIGRRTTFVTTVP